MRLIVIYIFVFGGLGDFIHGNSQRRGFGSNCPSFNFMCLCPKYGNGCYTCPSSCSSGEAFQSGASSHNFQPGVHPGSGSSGTGSQTSSGSSTGTSADPVPLAQPSDVISRLPETDQSTDLIFQKGASQTGFHPGAIPGSGFQPGVTSGSAFQPGIIPGYGSLDTSNGSSSVSNTQTGSASARTDLVCPSLANNCPRFMVKLDANDCAYCSNSGGPHSNNIGEAFSNGNHCPPSPMTDSTIPWSKCEIDRNGCLLCEGQIKSTTRPTTPTTTTTKQTTPTSTTTKQTTPTTTARRTTPTTITIKQTTPTTTKHTSPTSTLVQSTTRPIQTTTEPQSTSTTTTTTTTRTTTTQHTTKTTSEQATTKKSTTKTLTTIINRLATWSEWFYGKCSVSCGNGTISRLRHCNTGHDKDCLGSPFETVPCKAIECPVDGGWSIWSSWTTCTASCGDGTQSRTKNCDNPLPQHGGLHCAGPMNETAICRYKDCPHWLPFNATTACSVTCGTGFVQYKRNCSTGNQSDCTGSAYTENPCHLMKCL